MRYWYGITLNAFRGAASDSYGFDNEYRATPLLARLAELARDSTTRGEIEPVLARVRLAEANGDYDTRRFSQDIERIIRLFPSTPGAEVDHILYALQRRTRSLGTAQGDEIMRPVKVDLFLRLYEAAKERGEARPRVMFRFGGYHGARRLMRDFGGSTLANSSRSLH